MCPAPAQLLPAARSVNVGSCAACCCQALPELLQAGCSSRHYWGSSPELSAGSRAKDTCFGGELQGKLRTRLYLQQDLTTLADIAAPIIALSLKRRAGEQLIPTFCRVGQQPEVLAGLGGARLNSYFTASHFQASALWDLLSYL